MIEKPVPGVLARPHPGGKRGAMISLDETAKGAWRDRMSPRLRAWATQQLDKCGRPTGKRARVQCLLDAFRKKVPYLADPKWGEFIASSDQLLCVDEDKNLCFIGADCEEHARAMAALCLCIGIDAMIVGQSSRDPADVPTHVYFAFKDDLDSWVRGDSTTTYPVGRVAPYLREWWVDPSEGVAEAGLGDIVVMGATDGLQDAPKNGAVYTGRYAGLFSK